MTTAPHWKPRSTQREHDVSAKILFQHTPRSPRRARRNLVRLRRALVQPPGWATSRRHQQAMTHRCSTPHFQAVVSILPPGTDRLRRPASSYRRVQTSPFCGACRPEVSGNPATQPPRKRLKTRTGEGPSCSPWQRCTFEHSSAKTFVWWRHCRQRKTARHSQKGQRAGISCLQEIRIIMSSQNKPDKGETVLFPSYCVRGPS